jgi:hypothetical protein
MTLLQTIRAAAGRSAVKPHATTEEEPEEKPEESMEDDAEETDDAPATPAKDKEDDPPPADAASAARLAERRRIEGIFSAPEASRQPGLAAHLAFRTESTPADAIAAMKAAGDGKSTFFDRMDASRNPDLGGDARPDKASAIAASWDEAAAVANKQLGVAPRK